MAPKANQNTQLIVMGLAALTTAGLIYLLRQQQKASADDFSYKKLDDDEMTAKASNATGKKLDYGGRMDEKALHSEIEELDKKGKAYFKNKQVRVPPFEPFDYCFPFSCGVLIVCKFFFTTSLWRLQKPSRQRWA